MRMLQLAKTRLNTSTNIVPNEVSGSYNKRVFLLLAFISTLLISCKTTHEANVQERSVSEESPVPTSISQQDKLPDRVTLKLENVTLGEVVQEIGVRTGGKFAVMNGLEEIPISQVRFKNATFDEVATRLARETNCALQCMPSYFFIYHSGYERLTEISLAEVTSPPLLQNVELVQFGHGIPLFAVFSWLGQSLKTTIVADNAVADARCGEIALRDVRLVDAVEAILKTARVVNFRVETEPDYLFIYASANPNPVSCVIDEDSLDSRRKEYLERRVTVVLPSPPRETGKARLEPEALPLKAILPELSRQLGVEVSAEDRIRDFPVNPVAFLNVPVRVVMNLLIRQWLGGDCGFQFLSDRILIRSRNRG